LLKAYSKLKEARFLPQYSKQSTDQMLGQAEKCANAYPQLEKELQVLTIDLAVCISKLAMFTHRQIKRDDLLMDEKRPEGRRAKDQINQMRDHQEMLAHYADMLCSLRGPH
jgi:hypothetical protein